LADGATMRFLIIEFQSYPCLMEPLRQLADWQENRDLLSSWFRQWIEHVYQRKADAKDQLCPRSMFGKPIRRLAF
jgi:hypothetical protein